MRQVSTTPPTTPAAAVAPRAWRVTPERASLAEVYRSLPAAPAGAGFWRKLLAFIGPGYLVAVGYMDPGNWATDLAGGSAFGYVLLSVVLASSLAAMLLQALALRLGIATGRDLAQACHDAYGPVARVTLWLLCEVAICACDLAELIGSAIALKLLFHIPMLIGVCLTTADVLIIVGLRRFGFRYLEAVVIGLMAVIGGAFLIEMLLARPDVGAVLHGFIPQASVVTDPRQLYIAIGILGATIMPHNLYLHSSIVQTRRFDLTPKGRREAAKFATIDSTTALAFAMLVNAAILIVAAAAFHTSGHRDVAEIQDAYKLLSPLLGAPFASALFAIALLASGQNSTVTATLAAQIVMEGFVNIRLAPWLRRLITRSVAAAPAIVCVALWGERGAGKLLILSQVVLSLQLPFAVIPLILFTSDRAKMGEMVSGRFLILLAWAVAGVILALNLVLIGTAFMPR
jgi:manganese transport protein